MDILISRHLRRNRPIALLEAFSVHFTLVT